MSVLNNSAVIGLLGAAPGGGGGYEIERSLRFNSADSAYLNRTFGSAGSRQSWSWSGWVKQGNLSTGRQVLFGGYGALNDTDWIEFGFDTNNFYYTINSASSKSPAVFRDVSAWQHVTVTYNGSNLKWYSNGVEVHSVSTTGNLGINGNWVHTIGKSPNTGQTRYFNGYLADIHFIDGQALTPTSFGEFDTNGVWQPIDASGLTYGTNGFHLPFSDNSTAAALGTDSSSNGNTWTVNNLSVTAGSGNDSLVDTPTSYGVDDYLGGTVRGNYCTLNPLGTAGATPTNGNLSVSSSSTVGNRISTFFLTNGKWYWEGSGNGYVATVVGRGGEGFTGSVSSSGSKAIGWYPVDGVAYWDGGSSGSGTTYSNTDVIGVALDMDAGTVKFYKNNTLIHNLTFGSGTVPNLSTGVFPGYNVGAGPTSVDLNFGQRPFAYTAPSGFKALCTTNLPEPTIADGSTAMDVKLYTGNGSTQTISGLNFSPDLVWIKGRSGATDHALYDTVRTATKQLESNTTTAETTEATGLTAFATGGFSLGALAQVNTSSATYAAWTWDAGSSTVTNTEGSLTSQVRANVSAGFSVVSWTSNGSGSVETMGTGLGVSPSFVIVKNRDVKRHLGYLPPIPWHWSSVVFYNGRGFFLITVLER
jgi:hypothetical protein